MKGIQKNIFFLLAIDDACFLYYLCTRIDITLGTTTNSIISLIYGSLNLFLSKYLQSFILSPLKLSVGGSENKMSQDKLKQKKKK